ncbi:hypothetical protein Mx8p27 [Myxococcus phage Mx8]|uniref:p27 n=1 Tax=Myxococcus phage Mx8 TaxID=49964 RepID=Q94MU2_9CAUD|nr:hypothetical protein Mx8p27 [Myxococcus phage Mx8]AAK94362.1 p27 [Myxococcus phage Mx8]
MTPRHKWGTTESQALGEQVERCSRCQTERVRDTSTKSLFLFRRGHAKPPNGRPLDEHWSAFKASVTPVCVEVAP